MENRELHNVERNLKIKALHHMNVSQVIKHRENITRAQEKTFIPLLHKEGYLEC